MTNTLTTGTSPYPGHRKQLAEAVLLETESRTHFYKVLDNLIAEFPPGMTQHLLIETMAVCRWRQMRLWGFEQRAFTAEARRRKAESSPGSPIPFTALEMLHRTERHYTRMFARNLAFLKSLRSTPAQQFPSKLNKPKATV